MSTSKIDAILRLEFMIKHWDEIAATNRKYVCPWAIISPFEGICVAIRYTFSESFRKSNSEFINAVCPGKGCHVYPVGGLKEYITRLTSKNLFKNPDRKLYAHWVRDNIEWSLNPLQRIALKYKRPFYEYRTKM